MGLSSGRNSQPETYFEARKYMSSPMSCLLFVMLAATQHEHCLAVGVPVYQERAALVDCRIVTCLLVGPVETHHLVCRIPLTRVFTTLRAIAGIVGFHSRR